MGLEGLLFGALFGAALYFVGGHLPSRIMGMLKLQDFRLMKAIVFAIGLSSFLIALTSSLGIFDASHFSVKAMNLGVLVGGAIFGIGFGLGGTCPGTCVAALGGTQTWIKGILAVVGAILGALVFAQLYGMFADWGIFETLDMGKITLFNISEKYPSLLGVGTNGLYITGILFMLVGLILPQWRQDA